MEDFQVLRERRAQRSGQHQLVPLSTEASGKQVCPARNCLQFVTESSLFSELRDHVLHLWTRTDGVRRYPLPSILYIAIGYS